MIVAKKKRELEPDPTAAGVHIEQEGSRRVEKWVQERVYHQSHHPHHICSGWPVATWWPFVTTVGHRRHLTVFTQHPELQNCKTYNSIC